MISLTTLLLEEGRDTRFTLSAAVSLLRHLDPDTRWVDEGGYFRFLDTALVKAENSWVVHDLCANEAAEAGNLRKCIGLCESPTATANRLQLRNGSLGLLELMPDRHPPLYNSQVPTRERFISPPCTGKTRALLDLAAKYHPVCVYIGHDPIEDERLYDAYGYRGPDVLHTHIGRLCQCDTLPYELRHVTHFVADDVHLWNRNNHNTSIDLLEASIHHAMYRQCVGSTEVHQWKLLGWASQAQERAKEKS
jgi:hypothetical protein